MNGTDPSPQDVATEKALFTGHKVTVFLYNQQVTSSLTKSFISLAQASGRPGSRRLRDHAGARVRLPVLDAGRSTRPGQGRDRQGLHRAPVHPRNGQWPLISQPLPVRYRGGQQSRSSGRWLRSWDRAEVKSASAAAAPRAEHGGAVAVLECEPDTVMPLDRGAHRVAGHQPQQLAAGRLIGRRAPGCRRTRRRPPPGPRPGR